nr:T9SS type A sorting domain-containing protein [Fulvivirga sediminis]
MWNGIGPFSSWTWAQVQPYTLSAGNHTLRIAYREDGALLDKLVFTAGSAPSGAGSAASNCGGSGGQTIIVRAQGTNGSEQIRLSVNGTAVQTWTLNTAMSNYTATTSLSGNINVEFINDNESRDVRVDYIQVNGNTLQAENMATNTGVWQNDACGGQYSEWLHCNGYITFGSTASLARESAEALSAEIDGLSIYPNPTEDVLSITLPSTPEEGNLSIYDMNGTLLKKVNVEKGYNEINMKDFKSGTYIIKMRLDKEVISKKIIRK